MTHVGRKLPSLQAVLRRAHIGRNVAFPVVPQLVMATPGTRRFRSNKSKFNKYQRRYKRKYPRSGGRRVTRRPNRGAIVPLSVHRQYVETSGAIAGYPGTVVWPLQNPVLGNTPAAAACYVPLSYQEWQRGLADNEFSGSRVVLKNISVVMQMVAPEEVLLANAKPYRIRITQGWCKTNARVAMSSTVGGTRQLPNGMGVNQVRPNPADPLPNGVTTTPIHTTVRLALDDTVGIFGTFQTEGSYPRSQFHIIKDEFLVMTPTTEHDDENGGPAQNMIRAIKPVIRKFNWTCNKQLRVCPLTSAASVALSTDANSWFAPVNTPGDWIPFINISALNKSSYSTNLDLPMFKFTENTFFLDN